MLIPGDCVEVMRTLAPESVDAVVTDPPYGLEFMGKEWDRLEGVGEHRSTRPIKGAAGGDFGARMGAMPQYNSTANVRCRACEHWRFSGTPCTCAVPDFPSAKAAQGAEMQAWHQAWATEALRVLKPGGYLLAFGGTRTFHRLTCAIEDVGFEIRDCLSWMYASGFPKSLDVSKAIDKAAGATREVVGVRDSYRPQANALRDPQGFQDRSDGAVTVPVTPDAATWQGWGTALKPAWEPIIMARKPLIGTVAANVLKFGTGAINVDASRIEGPPWQAHDATGLAAAKYFTDGEAKVIHKEPHAAGPRTSRLTNGMN